MPRNAIVVGMPRSGTSLTARVFAQQGYFVADEAAELDPADRYNPFGYWQAAGLVSRNVEVYRAAGYPFKNSWLWDPMPDEVVERIASLAPLPGHEEFVAHYAERTPWVWKDPRLCFTLGYWWPLVDAERTAVVLLERSVDEVHRSFRRIGYVRAGPGSLERVALLSDLHLGAARRTLERLGIPHLVLAHRRFFDEPEGVAADLSRLFEIEVDAASLNVRSDLNHSGRRGRLVERIEDLYMLLPASARSALKTLTPGSVMTLFAPERKYGGETPASAERDRPGL